MSIESNLAKLPEYCYTVTGFGKELVVIKRGEPGYFRTDLSTPDAEKNWAIANHMNEKLGVSKAQEQAMSVGSMFGWHVPGADLSVYENTMFSGPREEATSAPEQTASFDEERAYSLNDGEYYLFIQTCEDGYDYTIYRRDFTEHDGGQYDDPDISMDEAIKIILEDFELDELSRVEYDVDELQEATYRVETAQYDQLSARIENAKQRMKNQEAQKEEEERSDDRSSPFERTLI